MQVRLMRGRLVGRISSGTLRHLLVIWRLAQRRGSLSWLHLLYISEIQLSSLASPIFNIAVSRRPPYFIELVYFAFQFSSLLFDAIV